MLVLRQYNYLSENPTLDVDQCAASNAAGTFDVPDNQQERFNFWNYNVHISISNMVVIWKDRMWCTR